jgi:hypothetical protein
MNHPASSTGDRGAGLGRPGLGSKWVVRASFGVSAALHLAVILVYPALMHRDVDDPVPVLLPTTAMPVTGMQMIELVDLAPEDPDRPEEPEEIEDVAAAELAPTLPDLEGFQGPVLIAPGPTAAERLRPDLRDERIWAPVARERVELTLEQRLDLDLAARILQARDSVAAAIAAGETSTDWTYTDSEGKRWGVTPGAIHLGDITIPLPNFALGSSKLEEQREIMDVWNAMQRQAARALVQESWKDRAQAIRARRDRERAARPDTIGRVP